MPTKTANQNASRKASHLQVTLLHSHTLHMDITGHETTAAAVSWYKQFVQSGVIQLAVAALDKFLIESSHRAQDRSARRHR
jgi:hypothetical protein